MTRHLDWEASPEELVREAKAALLDKLRASTEGDVLDAIDSSDMADALHGIAPVVLLSFHRAMIDQAARREAN